MTFTPFRVAVPEEVLDDLRERLARTRLPGEVDGAGWDQGTDLAFLADLLAYWRDEFDWRAAEERINAFDQLV
ncbi:MAG: epoxide hydrolase N-terminal domain-containing protein, partial [Actinomycetota bacterium]